jgi:hypothetical protein
MWWLRRLPDLEGVLSAFKVILSLFIAVYISALALRGEIFLKAPLFSLL